jgi:hypothetical protein
MAVELDPRWNWVDVSTLADLARGTPRYVKGYCNHLELEPVRSVAGEEVARLCRTCDGQLPPSREPDQPLS